ncbi:MAG TPA: type II toxin-antitoxin system VapC family toxin [Candidatus Hydrogenedentes bacterium]|nr:type II toxin-antitoxin system VapC family toxin [Candidatus Hydrogenedentota bacterium]
MTTASGKWVIDASVAIKLLVDEEDSDRVHLFFARGTETGVARYYVPGIFFVECANVLWKYVTRHDYPAAHAQKNLSRLFDFGFNVLDTSLLAENAFKLAIKHRISVYDASYLAASSFVPSPLITADNRLAKALPRTEYNIFLISELDLHT